MTICFQNFPQAAETSRASIHLFQRRDQGERVGVHISERTGCITGRHPRARFGFCDKSSMARHSANTALAESQSCAGHIALFWLGADDVESAPQPSFLAFSVAFAEGGEADAP